MSPGRVVDWSTRHLPLELRDRLRLLAVERRLAMWQLANEALLIGVTILEKRQAAKVAAEPVR
jgi:hypothetical protein